MQIAIDIRSTLKNTTGIGKYTLNLVNSLAEVDKKNNYYLYARKRLLDFKRRLPKLPARNFSHRIDYFKKGPDGVLPEVDIFHTSSYDLERPKKAKKFIVTIHDVIIKAYPFGHSEETISEVDTKLKRVLDQADLFVADSYNTKVDLIKFYGVDDYKVRVIYPGVFFTPLDLRSGGERGEGGKDSYILFVGTLEPRKNVKNLIKAFNWLKKEPGIKHKLCIVGMKGWMYEDIFKEYEESEFKSDIIFKGYVKDKELEDIYKRSSIFVYPSFYEGFGFPIVEAFSFGVPVITSKTSSCGEIAGDAALLIDPDNYKDIAKAILRIINDKNLSEELRRKGIARAREFNWIETAKAFLELFA